MTQEPWKTTFRVIGWTFVGAAFLLAGCAQTPPPKPVEISAGTFYDKWRVEVPASDGQVTKLFVRDEFLVAYTSKNTVYLLKKDFGTKVAIAQPFDEGKEMFAPILLKQEIVYPGILKIQVYDRNNGKYLREFSPDNMVIGTSGVGWGTKLFLGGNAIGGHGLAVCIDTAGSPYRETSQPWSLMTLGALCGAPALNSGIAYYGDDRGNVYAVNADSGQPVWPMDSRDTGLPEDKVFGTEGPILADLKADDSGVYVASGDSKFFCLDRTTGRVKWQYFAQVPLTYSPEITSTTVYVYADGKGLIALDKTNSDPRQYNRTPRWIMPDGRALLGEDDKYAYIERADGAIVAVDKMAGPAGAPMYVSKNRYTAFAVSNKGAMVFAVSKDGQIHGIVLAVKSGIIGDVASLPAGDDVFALAH